MKRAGCANLSGGGEYCGAERPLPRNEAGHRDGAPWLAPLAVRPDKTGRDGEADLRLPPNDTGGHRHYFFFAGAFFLAAGFFAGAFLAAGFFVVVLAKGVLLSM